MEKSLSDVQHRLSVKATELQAAHQQLDKLEERISKPPHISHTIMLTTSSVIPFVMVGDKSDISCTIILFLFV